MSIDKLTAEATFWREYARLLVSYPRADFIDHLLALLGKMHRADRVWLIAYNKEGTHFWNAHEWVSIGITPFVEALQATPISLIDWLHRQLLKEHIVYVADPDNLPRQARGLKAEFIRQGNKSVLCIPIFYEGRLCGVLGYDTVRQHASWNENEQALLRLIASDIGILMNHNIAETTPLLPAHSIEGNFVYIRLEHSHTAVNVDYIIMITAKGDYTEIIFTNRQASLELRSLKSWLAMLPTDRFIQVQRGTIIHSGRIERLERNAKSGWQLTIKGLDHSVDVGRAFRTRLRHVVGF